MPASSTATLPTLPPPRRVVTTHDGSGLAIVKSDDTIPNDPALGGAICQATLWTTGQTPANDNNTDFDGAKREVPGMGLVVPNGTNLRTTDLAPNQTTPMHRTNSIDYNIVLQGTLILILDDGSETTLGPGDTVIQRGTIHGWRNPSSTEWCRWVSVLVAADSAIVNGKELAEEWRSHAKL